MKVLGIIAEYNPYHNGHSYLIQQAKKALQADYVIVIMSGSFVQRGEAAICDKWTRAKMALVDGVDIVLELPYCYATSSAELFAYAAVSILDKLAVVTHLCFGIEAEKESSLWEGADILVQEPEQYRLFLKKYLQQGLVYPLARKKALEEYGFLDSETLTMPNNILAIEYIKALKRLQSKIVAFPIKRIGADYHDIHVTNGFASATAIRKLLREKRWKELVELIPEKSLMVLKESIQQKIAPVFWESFSDALNYRLRTMEKEQLAKIEEIGEGLENRILGALNKNYTIPDILNAVKTKRYTYTRLSRALLHVLLPTDSKEEMPLYARVLGFHRESQAILKEMVEKSAIPIITNFKNAPEKLSASQLRLLETEQKATNLFFCAVPEQSERKINLDYTHPMVIL